MKQKTYFDKLMEDKEFKRKFEEENKNMNNGFILEEDFIIPKGTMFKPMDGDATFYKDANYEALMKDIENKCYG